MPKSSTRRIAAPTDTAEKTETGRDKFLRLGQNRMVNAIHAIRLLGNLSANGYEWSVEDLALMKVTLIENVEAAFARFTRASSAPKPETLFKLAVTTNGH